jgi:hypothetical protein
MTASFQIIDVNETSDGYSTITLGMVNPGSFALAGTTPTGNIVLKVPTSLVATFVPGYVTTVSFS